MRIMKRNLFYHILDLELSTIVVHSGSIGALKLKQNYLSIL